VISIWVRVAKDGSSAVARLATCCPHYGIWVEFPLQRLLNLHEWLMNNCFLTLGDRVWHQCTGIPMGFSCSPIWCNIYLLSYEAKFIQCLAKLGRIDLLIKFQHVYRYIDDICLLNIHNPRDFLFPTQPRTDDNPFWIYPLNVLDIKEETSAFSAMTPRKGIAAHFMNLDIQINELQPNLFGL
jgi:hypothetical protein